MEIQTKEFIEFLKNGDIEGVKKLILNGYNVNTKVIFKYL